MLKVEALLLILEKCILAFSVFVRRDQVEVVVHPKNQALLLTLEELQLSTPGLTVCHALFDSLQLSTSGLEACHSFSASRRRAGVHRFGWCLSCRFGRNLVPCFMRVLPDDQQRSLSPHSSEIDDISINVV